MGNCKSAPPAAIPEGPSATLPAAEENNANGIASSSIQPSTTSMLKRAATAPITSLQQMSQKNREAQEEKKRAREAFDKFLRHRSTDLVVYDDEDDGNKNEKYVLVKCGVGLSVLELQYQLRERSLFIPLDLYPGATVGGHAHSPGYGMCGRSHGPFRGCIEGYGVQLHDDGGIASGYENPKWKGGETVGVWVPGSEQHTMACQDKSFSDQENEDLYHAITKGNLHHAGILTHLFLKAFREDVAEGRGAHGMKLVGPCTDPAVLQNCLQALVELSDNEDAPRDFDFRITVFTNVKNFWYKPTMVTVTTPIGRDDMTAVSTATGATNVAVPPLLVDTGLDGSASPVMIVYVQWSGWGNNNDNSNNDNSSESGGGGFGKFESAWFRRVRKCCGPMFVDATLDADGYSHALHDVKSLYRMGVNHHGEALDYTKPMALSDLQTYYCHDDVQEYLMPYENRTFATTSTELGSSGWSSWMANRIAMLSNGQVENMTAVITLQNFGGVHSMHPVAHETKPGTTLVQCIDCFYNGSDDAIEGAMLWQSKTERTLRENYGFKRIKVVPPQVPTGVVRPTSNEHLMDTIIYAIENGVGVRMGGPEGDTVLDGRDTETSNSDPIDLALGPLFHSFDYVPDKNLAKCSVTLSTVDLQRRLQSHGLFVPLEDYPNAAQLGNFLRPRGFGQIARSHGVLTDHVQGYTLVLVKSGRFGRVREVTVWKPGSSNYHADPALGDNAEQESDRLFRAVSNGTSSVRDVIVTHLWISPLHDKDYPKSRGMKLVAPYTPQTLQNLLQVMAELADNDDTPRDIDYRVTVLTDVRNFWYKRTIEETHYDVPIVVDEEGMDLSPIPILVAFVSWAGIDTTVQTPHPLFSSVRKAAGPEAIDAAGTTSHLRQDVDQLRHGGGIGDDPLLPSVVTPMSEIAGHWVYDETMEYVMPYEHRTYAHIGKSPPYELSPNGWSEWISRRIDMVVSGEVKNVKVVGRFQILGGSASRSTSAPMPLHLAHTFDCFFLRGDAKPMNVWLNNTDEEITKYGFVQRTQTPNGTHEFGSLPELEVEPVAVEEVAEGDEDES